MVSAHGARNQEFQAFIEFSCGFFVAVRGLGGEAEGGNMDGVPEKGSPDFWRDVHSISRHGFEPWIFYIGTSAFCLQKA